MENQNKKLSNLSNEKVDGEKIKGGAGGRFVKHAEHLAPGEFPPGHDGEFPDPGAPDGPDSHLPENQPNPDGHPTNGPHNPLHPPGGGPLGGPGSHPNRLP